MNKKGFTLIELLAVIVILAIIALIATPIVLNIIAESKESAQLRSAEMYLDAVEYGIADTIMNNKTIPNGSYTVMEDANICIGTYSNKACTGDIVEVEVNGEVPSEGSTITIEEGKIKDINLLYNDKTIIKDNKGNLVYEKTLDDICKYQNNGVAEKTAGAKYSCEVKPGTSYNFYILTTPSEDSKTINLIMDRNMCSDGTPTEVGKTCLVAWMSDSDYGCQGNYCATTDKGPITAMTYLYNATKNWTNIEPLNYTYMDKETQGTTGYTSFISTNGVAVITPLSGDGVTIGISDVPLRARMPIYSSDATKTEVASSNGSNEYLYENLDGSGWYGSGTQPINNIEGIIGYLTLSSDGSISTLMRCMSNDGSSAMGPVSDGDLFGVRPVITVKL